jgi:hypothetical protein
MNLLRFTAAALASSWLHAAVVLNPPEPSSGFYDYRDSNHSNGTGYLGPISSAQLPAAFGFSGVKVWGTQTLTELDPNGYQPSIELWAEGSASGSFDQAMRAGVRWNLDSFPQGYEVLRFTVLASLLTSKGDYFAGQSAGFAEEANRNGFSAFYGGAIPSVVIPAGTDVFGWRIVVVLSSCCEPQILPSVTLSIPSNSIDLVVFDENGPIGESSAVPEPATWLGVALGIAALRLLPRFRTW